MPTAVVSDLDHVVVDRDELDEYGASDTFENVNTASERRAAAERIAARTAE
ncbi:hypothetical protein [Salinigranum sp. GCM10025319]|uniref:hypothetical protein n=1 Tax=Salinigranum sp. GCM10025319 TaxID=3252687 RepID=UPI003620614C